jgi:DNA-binding NarL/FixJ family response regulator
LLHKVDYVFTCAELETKNKQVLILGSDIERANELGRVLQEKGMVVGKTTDPIEFFSNCLILAPRAVLIDIAVQGNIPAVDVIRGLSSFARLKETKILVYTDFAPENVDSMEGIEQLREGKNKCLEAGAHKYIGRFTPITIWDVVSEFMV